MEVTTFHLENRAEKQHPNGSCANTRRGYFSDLFFSLVFIYPKGDLLSVAQWSFIGKEVLLQHVGFQQNWISRLLSFLSTNVGSCSQLGADVHHDICFLIAPGTRLHRNIWKKKEFYWEGAIQWSLRLLSGCPIHGSVQGYLGRALGNLV